MEQHERLRQYNRWRRGEEDWSPDDRGPDQKELGELIDSVADRLEVLEREHQEFFERWHIERRKREALEMAILDDARRDHMARMEAKMFAPGAFVVLHHECKVAGKPHEDAGRIGRIVSRDGDRMVTEFWDDDLIGGATFCLIPFGHWAPVPEFCVEEYEPRAKRRGWRLNERGVKLFADMGWQRTKATIGDA